MGHAYVDAHWRCDQCSRRITMSTSVTPAIIVRHFNQTIVTHQRLKDYMADTQLSNGEADKMMAIVAECERFHRRWLAT